MCHLNTPSTAKVVFAIQLWYYIGHTCFACIYGWMDGRKNDTLKTCTHEVLLDQLEDEENLFHVTAASWKSNSWPSAEWQYCSIMAWLAGNGHDWYHSVTMAWLSAQISFNFFHKGKIFLHSYTLNKPAVYENSKQNKLRGIKLQKHHSSSSNVIQNILPTLKGFSCKIWGEKRSYHKNEQEIKIPI